MPLLFPKNNSSVVRCLRPSLFTLSKAMRFLAVLLVFAFLLPVIFVGNLTIVKAEKQPSVNPPPITAPPLPFTVSKPDSAFSGFAFYISNSLSAFSGFVTSPPKPEGLESAKTVSPASTYLTSFGNKLISIFGFFPTSNSSNALLTPPPPPPAGSVGFDFDGDGKADLSRFRASTNQWEIKNSSNGAITNYTLSGKIAPGDYDGDSITDIASFNNGTWTINKSSGGQQTVSWGMSGDIPVVGDYDGDGKSDLAIYRPSTNVWWILQSGNGAYTSTSFGAAGDITVQGNYDGDSKTDIAIYRPSTGTWHILGSSAGYFTYQWGVATDIPVPGDYDGDGITDFAVYRGSSGTWYAAKSSAAGQYISQVWGNYGDQPVPADYDGDGTTDFAIWRPTTGVWHTIKSSNQNYDYQTLGMTGDTAVPSAYLKQIGGQVFSYDLAKARLSPKNETGGTDLYSRNFGWGSGLVGLSGRAGLGAGFGISYNSLIWTKDSGSGAIYFDTDVSNLSPGFRFGFPVIEPVYWDRDTENFSYLMVTPSGARVEFRQIGASAYFETADSSYVQLKTKTAPDPNEPVEDIEITVTGTDGTQLTYLWKAGAFRCSEIKDRNGNFITIFHDDQGLLKTVTDTLGRVINVNYDSELYPTSITQDWKNNNGEGSTVQHTWATFSYTGITINTSFDSSLTVFGPPNGTSVKVLDKITYPNGSATQFEYNGYGQVWKVKNIAADSGSHILNYVSTNLQTPSSNQTDCPRFSETRSWVENFNNNQETVVTNTIQTGHQIIVPGEPAETATLVQVSMANHPTGNITNMYVGESGWKEGLPIAIDDYANGNGLEKKRWSWNKWTQDDTNLSYILNPRIIETKVGDAANIKRTTINYRKIPNTNISEYGLVESVMVYDTDLTTVLKKVETDYNLDSTYISRRIIGLPSETRSYGLENGTLALGSKVSYSYDGEDFTLESNQNISSVIQHDNTSYSANFVAGRANLTSTTRHDVLGQTSSVTSKVRYDIAGSVVAQITVWTETTVRKIKFDYTDSFNDTTNSRNTFAYPTTVTDSNNQSSTVKYRFDIGANVRAESPAPGNLNYGKITTRIFDEYGRLQKSSIWKPVQGTLQEYAYTRYEYPNNNIQSKIYSTIVDTDNNGIGNTADEVLAESWTDGTGRVRQSRTPMSWNSQGNAVTWSGHLTEYNIIGQVTRQSVAAEVDSNWNLAGDDATRGVWLWNSQEYDWRGRVTRAIPTDSNGSDGKDQIISYEGCGCAGQQITTVQSAVVPRDDNPGVNARRTQKVYEDILGRSYKTEILDWDGNVYKTILNNYNMRDQIVSTREIAGGVTSGDFRETTFSFDGHARLKSQHRPEQDSNSVTAFTYFDDDSIKMITDGRGATKNYEYNSRGLVEQVSYQSPSQVPITFTEPLLMQVEGNIDNSMYKLKFKGINFDSNAELSVKVYNGSTSQNLRYSNLQRTTENGEDVLIFDIASDSYLYNYANTYNYTILFTVINPDTNKSTQGVGVKYANGPGGRHVIVHFDPPVRNYSVSETPTVNFTYDNIGNRVSMNDGYGNVQYQYNELSQLTAETREFNETVPISPNSDNKFKIEYTYGLSGQLKSYKEPFGELVSYGLDKTGRLKTVSGNRTVENVQFNYLTDAKYRAWGALKEINYYGGKQETINFNNRLQPIDYAVSGLVHLQYDYNNDGSLKNSSYISNSRFSGQSPIPMFDRSYNYDFLGRLTSAKTGAEARGQTENNPLYRPYRTTINYNQYSEITSQERLHYVSTFNTSFEYNNGRTTRETSFRDVPGWQNLNEVKLLMGYDADGRRVSDLNLLHLEYNANGKLSYMVVDAPEYGDITLDYDGEGDLIMRTYDKCPTSRAPGPCQYPHAKKTINIKSSILGADVSEITIFPSISRDTKIYAGGKQIAERRIKFIGSSNQPEATFLQMRDVSGQENIEHRINTVGQWDSTIWKDGNGILDPFGAGVGYENPYTVRPPPDPSDPNCTWSGGDGQGGGGQYPEEYNCGYPEDFDDQSNEETEAGSVPENTIYVDGFETDIEIAKSLLRTGAADIFNPHLPDMIRLKHPITGEIGWGIFRNYGNNMTGWWADMNQAKPTLVNEDEIHGGGVDSVSFRLSDPKLNHLDLLGPFDGLDLVKRILEWIFQQNPSNPGASPTPTPSPTPNRDECFGNEQLRNSLGQTTKEGIPFWQIIQQASASAGISAADLAFTWASETGSAALYQNSELYETPEKGNKSKVRDHGPFQLSRFYVSQDVAEGLYQITDLGEQNVFGSEESPVFDGSVFANATVAARKIRALGVLEYGPKLGKGGRNLREERKQNYNVSIGTWRSIFDCLGR